jgi:nicotinamidase/pyrazinamidase
MVSSTSPGIGVVNPSERDEVGDVSIPGPQDALIVVDMQQDFLPGGALGVPEGDTIIPVLNRWVRAFARAGRPVVFTRDWHPADHCSFEAQGGTWPPHCVSDTEGARFATGLELPQSVWTVSKGTHAAREAYSGFQGTELDGRLRQAGVERVFVGGLATDYCVKSTVEDALARGFEVFVLEEAIRPVEVSAGDGRRAIEAMRSAGARLVSPALSSA